MSNNLRKQLSKSLHEFYGYNSCYYYKCKKIKDVYNEYYKFFKYSEYYIKEFCKLYNLTRKELEYILNYKIVFNKDELFINIDEINCYILSDNLEKKVNNFKEPTQNDIKIMIKNITENESNEMLNELERT